MGPPSIAPDSLPHNSVAFSPGKPVALLYEIAQQLDSWHHLLNILMLRCRIRTADAAWIKFVTCKSRPRQTAWTFHVTVFGHSHDDLSDPNRRKSSAPPQGTYESRFQERRLWHPGLQKIVPCSLHKDANSNSASMQSRNPPCGVGESPRRFPWSSRNHVAGDHQRKYATQHRVF